MAGLVDRRVERLTLVRRQIPTAQTHSEYYALLSEEHILTLALRESYAEFTRLSRPHISTLN